MSGEEALGPIHHLAVTRLHMVRGGDGVAIFAILLHVACGFVWWIRGVYSSSLACVRVLVSLCSIAHPYCRLARFWRHHMMSGLQQQPWLLTRCACDWLSSSLGVDLASLSTILVDCDAFWTCLCLTCGSPGAHSPLSPARSLLVCDDAGRRRL